VLEARPSGYRAVLFDALGTLVELEPPWPRLRRALEQRHGVAVSEEQAKEAMLAEMAYYRAHHNEGSDHATLGELRRRCALVLRDRLTAARALSADEMTEALLDSLRFVPYADAAETLAVLRAAGLRLAVVSNWDCSLPSILAEVGLAAAVDEIVVSAQVGVSKPDPRIFEAALERLRCKPQEAVFVGDSLETDVAGARAAGIRSLMLDRHPRAAEAEEVERIISLTDMLELLQARPRNPDQASR
jgi:putative hydrolase of the HAD superfamily